MYIQLGGYCNSPSATGQWGLDQNCSGGDEEMVTDLEYALDRQELKVDRIWGLGKKNHRFQESDKTMQELFLQYSLLTA